MTPLFTGLTRKMGTMASVQHALGLETAQKAPGARSISMNTTSLPSLSSVLSAVKGGGGVLDWPSPPLHHPGPSHCQSRLRYHSSLLVGLPNAWAPAHWPPVSPGGYPGCLPGVHPISPWLDRAPMSSPREVLPGDPSQSVHLTAVTQSPHYGSSNLRRHISCWCICSLMYLLSAPI